LAYCELNYTPLLKDGSVDIIKALNISEAFEISKQFWASLVKEEKINYDVPFINDLPHISFVMGDKNISFLKNRHKTMTRSALFEQMKYEEDHEVLKEWMPLLMEGRSKSEKLASTKMDIGTDVNFGAITRSMIKYLETTSNVTLYLGQEVTDISHSADGWIVEVEDLDRGYQESYMSDFVFIGAGGGAIPLLELTDLEEAKGYAGFPVSGQWLRCKNPEIIRRHEAKVYGKAATGNPPMSVPHLDTTQFTLWPLRRFFNKVLKRRLISRLSFFYRSA